MDNTELKIKNAARKIFILKGMEGARMQEIADKAGINKALLHYYFRSKQKLFDTIFEEAFQQFVPDMHKLLSTSNSSQEIVHSFVNAYFSILEKNPFLPQFILGELNRNPSRLINLMANKIGITSVVQKGKKVFSSECIKLDKPVHLFVSILSMIIFPFIAQPIIHNVFFNQNKEATNKFYAERKEYIINSVSLLLNASRNSNNN